MRRVSPASLPECSFAAGPAWSYLNRHGHQTRPLVPPAPKPRQTPPSTLQMLRIINRNPLELWGEPSYNKPWISISTGIGGPLVIANDPGLIRHVLVDNVKNYKMAKVR